MPQNPIRKSGAGRTSSFKAELEKRARIAPQVPKSPTPPPPAAVITLLSKVLFVLSFGPLPRS